MATAAPTEQYDHAQQDGHQGAGAEAGGRQEGLALAGAGASVAAARAHAQGEGAGAAEAGLPAVPHHHGQAIELLGQVTETAALGHDAGCAVWSGGEKEEKKKKKKKKMS